MFMCGIYDKLFPKLMCSMNLTLIYTHSTPTFIDFINLFILYCCCQSLRWCYGLSKKQATHVK